ncbi:MAG: N-6 DNA methylase, partial [bacterium]|nr:N-6 DNA methylase [bacterium]
EFDYLLANPPYGKDWKRDKEAVDDEHALGEAGRFAPGLPRISDGQTLFLMHMVHHMKPPERGGSRVLIIMLSDKIYRIHLDDSKLKRNYASHLLASSIARFQLARDSTDASLSRQNISKEAIGEMILPIPPADEQITETYT